MGKVNWLALERVLSIKNGGIKLHVLVILRFTDAPRNSIGKKYIFVNLSGPCDVLSRFLKVTNSRNCAKRLEISPQYCIFVLYINKRYA